MIKYNNNNNNSTPIDRAHLLSISSPHASAWLSVTPSLSMGLHLEPSEFQVAINGGSVFQLLKVKVALNVMLPWMLMAIMHCVASWGGDVSRHNKLRDIFNDVCHFACLAPQLEMGGWSREHTHPLMFLFQTGSWVSQQHLTCLSHQR